LLRYIGKTKTDDEPLSLLAVMDAHSVQGALSCLRAVDACEKEKRMLAVAFARDVQHLITDPRSLEVLDVAERYANGGATERELREAASSGDDRVYRRNYAYADAAAYLTAYIDGCDALYGDDYYVYFVSADAADAAYYAGGCTQECAKATIKRHEEIFRKFCVTQENADSRVSA
jgi:hypothetical protein